LDIEKIISLLRLTNWTNSSSIEKFENNFAETINALRAFAIHQGRSALLLGLKSLDIGSEDEVIVQSLICRVVIDAILEVGAMPVLVDNSLDDYQISPVEIKKKITSKTKAIIAAHLYGIPCQIEEIYGIAKKNNCYLMEDCAHSLGAQYNGKSVGTYGDLAFFSFNYDKPVSIGNGGMLVVNNPELVDNVERVLKHYERVPLQEEKKIIYGFILQHLLTQRDVYRQSLPTTFGEWLIKNNLPLFSMFESFLEENLSEAEISTNILDYLEGSGLLSQKASHSIFSKLFFKVKTLSKRFLPRFPEITKVEQEHLLMNSLRASIGFEQLKHLNLVGHVRNNNMEYLVRNLDRKLYSLPQVKVESMPAFFRYPVLNQTRLLTSEISKIAKDKGFEISNYNWPNPVHLSYPYCKILSYDTESLRNSVHIAHQLLNMPIHYYVDEKDLEIIVTMLNRFEG